MADSLENELHELRSLFWSERDPDGRVFAPLADAYRRQGDLAQALDLLREMDPSIDVRREERVVRDGVVTSAGVAAGIDMAFSIVEDLFGRAVADETAHYIEYPRA